MNKYSRYIGIAVLMAAIVFLSFYLADYVSENDAAKSFIEKFGVLGILVLAIFGGFNIFVPVHAATFTPIFLEAGFSLPLIIVVLSIGTTLADLLSYVLGHFGKDAASASYPKVQKRVTDFVENHHRLMIPGAFLYSAFVPFPNEVMLVPLGLFGVKIWKLILPIILGTLVNQTIFAIGAVQVFELLF